MRLGIIGQLIFVASLSSAALAQGHQPREWVILEFHSGGTPSYSVFLDNVGGASYSDGSGVSFSVDYDSSTGLFDYDYSQSSDGRTGARNAETADVYLGPLDTVRSPADQWVAHIVDWGDPIPEDFFQDRQYVVLKLSGTTTANYPPLDDWFNANRAEFTLMRGTNPTPNWPLIRGEYAHENGLTLNVFPQGDGRQVTFTVVVPQTDGGGVSIAYADLRPEDFTDILGPEDFYGADLEIVRWGPKWVDADGDGSPDNPEAPPPDRKDTDGDGIPDDEDDDDDGDGIPDDQDPDSDGDGVADCDFDSMKQTIGDAVPVLVGISAGIPPVLDFDIIGAGQLLGVASISLGVSPEVDVYRQAFRYFILFLVSWSYYSSVVQDAKTA